MSVYTTTHTRYIAVCNWCELKVEITNNNPHLAGMMNSSIEEEFQRELPARWWRDWSADKEHPPIYCSETHMDRARQVAALKTLP
jgi:hypothetical protein